MFSKKEFKDIIKIYLETNNINGIITYLDNKDIDYQKLFINYIINEILKKKNNTSKLIEIYFICVNYYEYNNMHIATNHKKSVELLINDLLNNNYNIDSINPYFLINILEYIKDESKKEKIYKILFNNFEYIVNNYNLFLLKNKFKENNYLKELLNNYLNNNINLVAKDMYYSVNSRIIKYNSNDDDNKNRDNIIKILAIILKEICDNEKVQISDIEKIGEGSTSNVYLIGNKVIKVGRKRYSNTIPNNPYVIKPLLRKYFSFKGTYEEGIFIEIIEKVLVVNKDQVSIDELYNLYKNLRDINIEWLDIEYRNVGRLLKNNNIYWNEELNPVNDALMMVGNESALTLNKGDLIILDSDLIYDINDKFNYGNIENYSFYKTLSKFRKRYKKEKNKKE